MKVAVCMSGQPRFLDCYDTIYNNVIAPNNADVFLHAWSYENKSDEPYKYGGDGGWKNKRIDPKAHEKAIEIYKPISSKTELTRKFFMPSICLKRTLGTYSPGTEKEAAEAGMSNEEYREFWLSNNLSMLHSIYESSQLMFNHCLSTGKEYDAIIRCRFDININQKVLMNNFDLSNLYSLDQGKKYGHITDWFNFSNFENMMVFASTFLTYKKIYKDIESVQAYPICNEMAFAINLERHGISRVNLKLNHSLPRF